MAIKILKLFSKPFMIKTLSLISVLVCIGIYILFISHHPPVLEVYIIPLKGGQVLFIRTPSDKRILVDGGSTSEVIRCISGILPFYSRHIDFVVVTKPDAVHVAGLVDVINRYDIGGMLLPSLTLKSLGLSTSTDQIYSALLEAGNTRHIPTGKVSASSVIALDSTSLDFLFPVEPELFKYSKSSDPELVFNILYRISTTSKRIVSILNIGGITPKIQKYIASSSNMNIGVLITSKNLATANLSQKFLERFRPQKLIYSGSVNHVSRSTSSSLRLTEDIDSYNIQETGPIKIAINGSVLTIDRVDI